MAEDDSHSLTSRQLGELADAARPLNPAYTRFATLDVLRGFALLGILLLNVESLSGPESLWDIPIGLARPAFVGWHADLDVAVVVAKWLVAEGKMRGLFALLFGAGSVMLVERAERTRSRAAAAGVFYRRNLWLLAFGLAHGTLLWAGDILTDYALLGLVFLYPLRRLSARVLITLGLAVWILAGGAGVMRAFEVPAAVRTEWIGGRVPPPLHGPSAAAVSVRAAASPETARKVAVGRQDYLSGWRDRLETEIKFLKFKFLTGWALEWLGAMITGMGLYQAGFLTNAVPRRLYVTVGAIGYLVSWPLILVGLALTWRAGLTETAQSVYLMAPYSLQVAAGTLANASVILLIVRSGKAEWLTRSIGAVGRTAFSNYILTTVICKVLFSWSALRLYGALEYYQVPGVVAGVWIINVSFSRLWLARFNFGPLEWLWRSLTNWKNQPLLRR